MGACTTQAPHGRLSQRSGRRRRPHSYSNLSPAKAKPFRPSSPSISRSVSNTCINRQFYACSRRNHQPNVCRRERVNYLRTLFKSILASKESHAPEATSSPSQVFIPRSKKELVSKLTKYRSSLDKSPSALESQRLFQGDGVELYSPVNCAKEKECSLQSLSARKCVQRADKSHLRPNRSSDIIVIPTASSTDSDAKEQCHQSNSDESVIYLKQRTNLCTSNTKDSEKYRREAIQMSLSPAMTNYNEAIAVLLDLELDSEEDILDNEHTEKNISDVCLQERRSEHFEYSSKSQENYNTNSGLGSTHRKRRTHRDMCPNPSPSSASSGVDSVESDLSSDNEERHHRSSYHRCSDKKRRQKQHDQRLSNRDGDDDETDKLKYHKRHQAQEAQHFCKKMASQYEPNEIAIGVARKYKAGTKTKECAKGSRYDSQTRTLDKKRHPHRGRNNCRECSNNSSYRTADHETSSRRCRSMGERNVVFGRTVNVGSRGISVGYSSSDEGSSRRHRQVAWGRETRGRSKSKTPAGRQVMIGSSSKDKGKQNTFVSSYDNLRRSAPPATRSRSKSPAGRGRSPAPGVKTIASSVSRGTAVTSASKTSTLNEPKGSVSRNRSAGQVGSKLKVSESTTDGIVPLTPEEICERCNKYRMDQEIGDCIPLDFSHVQQLEKLAETVTEESARKLLKTVTAIIEEKVCKQMFRCLMPCCCPGCKDRPTVCESIEKFFEGSSNAKDKKKTGGKAKSGKDGAKAGKKKGGKESPRPGSPTGKGKSKGGGKGKGKKGDGEQGEDGGPGGDCCGIPSLSCCRGPSMCYYDKDRCYRCPPRWNNHWTNSASSMRFGWWPGSSMRCYDRCWSNRSGEQPQATTDTTANPIFLSPKKNQHGASGTGVDSSNRTCSSGAEIMKEETLGAWSKERLRRNFNDTVPENHSTNWADQTRTTGIQEPTTPATTTISDLIQRYGPESFTPCPHDSIPPIGKNLSHFRSRIIPNYYSNPLSIRDRVMSVQSKTAWDSSRVQVNDGFADHLKKDIGFPPVGSTAQEESDRESPDRDNASQEDKAPRRRKSPRKARCKKAPSKSRQTSPTTAVIGELEARTKELIAEAKLNTGTMDCLTDSKPSISNGVENSNCLFSPIKPPDVNTAYSVHQGNAFGATVGDSSDNKDNSQQPDERQWWDGFPRNMSKVVNPVVFKSYNPSSAMPVSVRSMASSTAPGQTVDQSYQGDGRPATFEGRSHSEPRPPQGGADRKGSRTPRPSQHQSTDATVPDTARKTGSYTVCKGRAGKQTAKGSKKSSKRMWKY